MAFKLFAILQKYDFSSKSQPMFRQIYFIIVVCDTAKVRFFKQITTTFLPPIQNDGCLRYCKSTIFQANHNQSPFLHPCAIVVCDTAKVRFFKQITTPVWLIVFLPQLFAILQKYDFSSKSQPQRASILLEYVVCDTAKVRFFKQITTLYLCNVINKRCLRYCKSTIFQANHNVLNEPIAPTRLFAILQKYDFSSKSQQLFFKAPRFAVVCDTAKVRFFKQITTCRMLTNSLDKLFAILQKYDFSSKSQPVLLHIF